MTTRLVTEDKLRQLQKLHQESTAGPWTAEGDGREVFCPKGPVGDTLKKSDALFIVEAKEWLGLLVDETDRCLEENGVLKRSLAQLERQLEETERRLSIMSRVAHCALFSIEGRACGD